VQRSFANTNFSARLKFPAATVATTTMGTSVLRVGLQESLCTAGERRPGNECEFYLSNFRQMPIAHVLGGIVVWNPSSAHPSTSFSPIQYRFLLLITFSLSLSLTHTHTHIHFLQPLSCFENYFHYRACPINATFIISVSTAVADFGTTRP